MKTTPDQSDTELVKAIEKTTTDPFARRALFFNFKWKQAKNQLIVVVSQRDREVEKTKSLTKTLNRQRYLRIALVIGGLLVGFSLGLVSVKIAQVLIVSPN